MGRRKTSNRRKTSKLDHYAEEITRSWESMCAALPDGVSGEQFVDALYEVHLMKPDLPAEYHVDACVRAIKWALNKAKRRLNDDDYAELLELARRTIDSKRGESRNG